MGKDAYIFSKTVDESQCMKIYVKPRMAMGGAIGAEAAVTRLTN
jgi:hypothetical protein